MSSFGLISVVEIPAQSGEFVGTFMQSLGLILTSGTTMTGE